MNYKNFDNPQTLTPMNKNDSTVINIIFDLDGVINV